MNYIQQTWKIEDDVAEWRETFKILNTEKDFFLLVILFIPKTGQDSIVSANQIAFITYFP